MNFFTNFFALIPAVQFTTAHNWDDADDLGLVLKKRNTNQTLSAFKFS
jgi:hypothetical protein